MQHSRSTRRWNLRYVCSLGTTVLGYHSFQQCANRAPYTSAKLKEVEGFQVDFPKTRTENVAMKIATVQQIPAEKVEMDGAKDCQVRLAVTARDGAPNFAMRIFEVAPGGHTPLHHHPYEHEIYVREGKGSVWQDGREVQLEPGHILYIPADEQHQFKNAAADRPFKFMCLIPAKFQKC